MKSAKPDLYLHMGWFPLPKVQETIIAGAPAFMQGLNALFVSDVHLRRPVAVDKLDALMGLISAQKADMILFGGDYAESSDQHRRFFQALSGVQARLGIYGVMGNNDREAFPDIEAFRSLAAKGGMRLLVNESLTLESGLSVGGCDDHKHGNPITKDLFSGGAYRILISHFPVKPDCDAELMLSGHTHGGQFNFLGITPYSIGFEHRYRMESVSGLQPLNKGKLLVSEGIGVSRLPLRLGVKPKIHLLKFTS